LDQQYWIAFCTMGGISPPSLLTALASSSSSRDGIV